MAVRGLRRVVLLGARTERGRPSSSGCRGGRISLRVRSLHGMDIVTVSPELSEALDITLLALVMYAIGWWRGYTHGTNDERKMWEWNFPDWEPPSHKKVTPTSEGGTADL